jgi:uncharacterized phage protein gp47/JayE
MQAKDFQTLVREQVAAIQGGSKVLVDLSVGSILRAVVEAYSAVALWLQWLILQLLAVTRAATSSGADLDSWVADYGLTRLPAAVASGQVTFSRFTATQQAVVPVGSKAQTADGTQQYAVTTDTTNSAYSATLGGYVLAAGNAAVTVPVVATTAGAAGNAALSGINTLAQAIPGIDTVTNAAAFTNGADAESDAALRARFIAYLASLSKATKTAISYAVTALKQGMTCTLTENQQYNGTASLGYFYVVVDDGTGYPSGSLLSTVYNAVDAVRPFTVAFAVFAPAVVTANATMTITTAVGYLHTDITTLVQTAITNAINALGLGNSLPFTRLAQIAYDASPYVTNVTGVTLNGATADLAATKQQTIKAGTVVVA